MGDETIRGFAVTPLSLLVDVEKRAYKGGTAGGGETAVPKGIGEDGTGFTGASLFFLRRKPAMEAVVRVEVRSEDGISRHEEYKHCV